MALKSFRPSDALKRRPIRVLVVDDSAFARKVLTQILNESPGIRVIGSARDGLEALERIHTLRPDVVTLDLAMPQLDGLGVLDALPPRGGPRVLVVSMSSADSELGLSALQKGAVDLVRKPTALAANRLYELSDELIAKVEAAALASPSVAETPDPVVEHSLASTHGAQVVVIGTSTGGPQALMQLIPSFPGDFPVPIVAALHTPADFTRTLAERLDRASQLRVIEGRAGIPLTPGLCVLAPGGVHTRLLRREHSVVISIDASPGDHPYHPSIDVLFASAAEVFGRAVLAVVLTGMGTDGLKGARSVRSAGGIVLTQSQASCAIYGMPRSVDEAHLSCGSVPLPWMAREIAQRI